MTRKLVVRVLLGTLGFAAVGACSGKAGVATFNDVGAAGVLGSGSNGSGATGTGASSSGGSATGANGSGGSSGLMIDLGGDAQGGASSPEICDGIDNDHNGIIDDVDVGHDGVCDCLNIATVGHIGPWSNGGNIFASWLDARSPLGAVPLEDKQLTADELKKFEIVVVLHVATIPVSNNGATAPAHHAFSDAEVKVFEDWVRGGGGVMTTTGYTLDEPTEVVNVNKLLSNLGMGYSTKNFGLNDFVKTWDKHPVTDGITNIYTNNGIDPDGMAGTTVAHGGTDVALQVAQLDKGRAVVWGDEWITYDSEWADVRGQQVEHFWLNILKWLTPSDRCQVPIPERVK
jgi:hypothetical protein